MKKKAAKKKAAPKKKSKAPAKRATAAKRVIKVKLIRPAAKKAGVRRPASVTSGSTGVSTTDSPGGVSSTTSGGGISTTSITVELPGDTQEHDELGGDPQEPNE